MAFYTWGFGVAGSGLHATVVYDSALERFEVQMLEGSMDLNALWFSDGNAVSSGYSLSRADNSLNMNGTAVAWDSYLKVSRVGLGADGDGKSSYLTAGESLLLAAPAGFNPAASGVLGLRATSVNGTGSIKLVDKLADVIAPAQGQVLIYDANNVYTGVSFMGATAIQQAIDAAVAGSRLYVGAGTYEGVVLNKQLSIYGSGRDGAGATIIDPGVNNIYGSLDGIWLGLDADGSLVQSLRITGGTNGIQVEGGAGANVSDNLVLKNVLVDANSNYGVNLRNGNVGSLVVQNSEFSRNGTVGFRVPSTGNYASIVITGSAFIDNSTQGFATLGGLVGELTIADSVFSGNGTGGASGHGDLILNTFAGDASLSRLVISGDGGGSNGLQITGPTAGSGTEPDGRKATVPIGLVSIDDVAISGSYARDVVTIGRYTDLEALSVSGLEITAQQGLAPGWAQFNVFNAGGDLSLADFGIAEAGLRANLSSNNGVNFASQPDATVGADLVGGTGVDVLTGWTLSDRLTGGAGADLFVFNAQLNAVTNVDQITDFQAGDLIALDDAVFSGLSNGSLAVDYGTKILYDGLSGSLSFDADGDGLGAVQFATLTNLAPLTAADFLII